MLSVVTTLAASALAVVLAAAPASCQPAPTASPCPVPNGAVFDTHGQIDFSHAGTYGIEPGSACEAHLERWAAKADAQLIEGLENGPPATTWTVQDVHFEGDRCVISLREVGDPEHFSRRITTPADCQAHPVGSTYHTGTEGGAR